MANDVKFLNQAAWDRLERMLLAFERGGDRPPNTYRTAKDLRDPPPIRVILLDNLECMGTVDAAVTEIVESTSSQRVAILGYATGGTFQLQFGPSMTGPLAHNIAAAELQLALESLESIGTGNVLVSLGPTTGDTPHPTPCWLVSFVGKFLDEDVDLLTCPLESLIGVATIEVSPSDQWADTGRIEQVRDIIPVGYPTPMRAGAVAAAFWFHGAGYGLIGCEYREFDLDDA